MGRLTGLEVRRKLFHIATGTIIAVLLLSGWLSAFHLTLLFFGLLTIFLVYTRFRLPLIHEMLVQMEREENMRTFAGIGASFFVLGMALAAWLFPAAVAAGAILILAWGDGISGLVGPYGKLPYINHRKAWEGILAGIAAGTLAASFAVPFVQALSAAAVAMLLEGLDLKLGSWKVDDNLLIPLVAGVVMLAVRSLAP